MRRRRIKRFRWLWLVLLLFFSVVYYEARPQTDAAPSTEFPKWNGQASIEVNGGKPKFSKKLKKQAEPFETYAELDEYGRAGAAIACLGPETVNPGERQSLNGLRPSGWETAKYPDIVEGLYVYNRCHLLMQKAAAGWDEETCNSERNIVTGTRYLNVDGMLPYENEVLHYIEEENGHVLCRVKPVYKGAEAVCRGVRMEAWSIEDKGRQVRFSVYCFNVQPGIKIDYGTGRTKARKHPQKEMALALLAGAGSVMNLK